VLLRAKDVAEEEGFEVLHMYVDALWVKKKGCNKPEHFTELIKKINHRTGLTINLDGVYRWVAFLPSKVDPRVPVANRYFGVFQSGEIKVRGLEARRRDTPLWIAAVQKEMISLLGQAHTKVELEGCIQESFDYYQQALQNLKAGLVLPEQLVINGKVSYALEAYKASTASVRAAKQLQNAGMTVRPGMRVRFVYTRGEPDVVAWDLGVKVEPAAIDSDKYIELLIRAASSVLSPFGISVNILREWSLSDGLQLHLPAAV
jgi:DNA polymerase-2